MASASADSCETGCEVNLKWIVTSGGSVNYTVSVDGTEQSGASAKLTCQATAGTQSVKVKATDRTYPQLTATRTLSLTVTKPAPPTSATAQIHARRLADNRVEFTLRLKDGTEVITANRYMKLTEIVAGHWYASGAFTTTIEGVEYTLGRSRRGWTTQSVRLRSGSPSYLPAESGSRRPSTIFRSTARPISGRRRRSSPCC